MINNEHNTEISKIAEKCYKGEEAKQLTLAIISNNEDNITKDCI